MFLPMLTLPYLTRVLSVELYGVVAYVKAYTTYVQLLLDFGFLFSVTRYIATVSEDKEKIGYAIGDTVIEKIFLALGGILITLIISCNIEIVRENQKFVWLYFIACVLTILIPDFVYRGIEQMEYVAIPFVLSKVIVVILTFVFVKNDNSYLFIPLLEIVGNVVAAIISVSFLIKLKYQIKFTGIRKWYSDIKESSVYFFSNIATTFFGALTTLVVGIYMSKTEIAYWGLCMQVVAAAKAMYSPIVNSIYPHMVVNRDIKLVKRIALIFGVILIVGCMTILLGGEEILSFIGGPSYKCAGVILKYLIPVFVVSFYSMLFGWPVLGAINKVKENTYSTIIAAICQTVGILLLIMQGKFELISLAVCCCVAEMSLLGIRIFILYINRHLLYM